MLQLFIQYLPYQIYRPHHYSSPDWIYGPVRAVLTLQTDTHQLLHISTVNLKLYRQFFVHWQVTSHLCCTLPEPKVSVSIYFQTNIHQALEKFLAGETLHPFSLLVGYTNSTHNTSYVPYIPLHCAYYYSYWSLPPSSWETVAHMVILSSPTTQHTVLIKLRSQCCYRVEFSNFFDYQSYSI